MFRIILIIGLSLQVSCRHLSGAGPAGDALQAPRSDELHGSQTHLLGSMTTANLQRLLFNFGDYWRGYRSYEITIASGVAGAKLEGRGDQRTPEDGIVTSKVAAVLSAEDVAAILSDLNQLVVVSKTEGGSPIADGPEDRILLSYQAADGSSAELRVTTIKLQNEITADIYTSAASFTKLTETILAIAPEFDFASIN